MEQKPINKQAVAYLVLEIAMREQAFTTDQMMRWLPAGTKRSSMASALVNFCQAGVMTVRKEVLDGRTWYRVTGEKRHLGTDALYVQYVEYRREREKKYSKGKVRKPAKVSWSPVVEQLDKLPSVIEIKITGTVEHIFTFKIGR